jgi:peptide/nickel transport system substrate-binding protein
MNSKRDYGRMFVYAAVVLALAVAALPRTASAAPAQQGSSRTFPETNQTVSGRFLEVWQGGRSAEDALYINGFPITDNHDELSLEDGKVYKMQWFERARYEAHPENKAPYDVLLGRLGAYAAEGRADAPFKAIDNPGGGVQYFPETKHSVGDSSAGGKIIATFWGQYGGVSQFGFPLSQPFQEVTRSTDPAFAGKSFLVQYFERQRLEYHPENAGTKFEVLLGVLGSEQVGQAGVQIAKYAADSGTAVDTLRIGMSQEPDSLYSLVSSLVVSTIVLGAIERGLTGTDNEGNRFAEVAAFRPTIDNGGAYYIGTGKDQRLVVKYKLRHGVKWSDGVDVTSNDVIYGYKLLLDPATQVADRSLFQKVSTISNPDPYTLVYNFLTSTEAAAQYAKDPETYGSLKDFVDAGKAVVDPFYFAVGNTLFPEHVMGKIGAADMEAKYGRNPVGVGPYKLVKWESGQYLDLTANEYFDDWNPNAPRIKNLRFNIVTDSNALLAQTQAGNHDIITSDALTLDQSPTLDKLQGKAVNYIPATTWEHLELNTSSPKLSDVKVRQAIAYALNRQAVIDSLLYGKTKVLNSWLTPGYAWSADNPKFNSGPIGSKFKIATYEYSPAKANALLDEAGWVKGGDGIRAKGGVRLSLDWYTTVAAVRQNQTLAFKQDLAAVGIELKQTFLPAAAALFGSTGVAITGQYDVAGFAYSSDVDPGGFSIWHSSNVPTAENNFAGQNYTRFKNDRADTLITIANNSIGETERANAYAEHQQIVSQQVPIIGLYTRPNITVAPSGLKNWKPTSSLIPPTWNAEQWFLAK